VTVRIDLGGFEAVPAGRRARALSELAELAAAAPPDALEVVASGEAAFAARLSVGPGTAVSGHPVGSAPSVAYRAFGEACQSPLDDTAVLVEAGDLGRLTDGEEGAAEFDGRLGRRLQALAAADRVTWRVATDWQADLLADRFGVPDRRIARLPADVPLLSSDRLRSVQLPPDLPEPYALCLTPLGARGDLEALIRAHAALGETVPPLVVLGVEDEAWRPALAAAVADVGTRGRVLLLRDLDPGSEVAAIARARAVVAVDRHPAHAVRLRRAAMLERPAAVRRHPGHEAWVDGGSWFADDVAELTRALREPQRIRLRERDGDSRDPADLRSWLGLAGRRDEPREVARWAR